MDRNEPKDLADLWGFSCRMGLPLRAAIRDATGKAAGVFEPDLARVLCVFVAYRETVERTGLMDVP